VNEKVVELAPLLNQEENADARERSTEGRRSQTPQGRCPAFRGSSLGHFFFAFDLNLTELLGNIVQIATRKLERFPGKSN